MSALANALAEEGRPDDIFAQISRIQSERDAARAQVTVLQEANNRAVDESRAARHAADFLRERICALALAIDAPDFQPRTDTFMQACFGATISADRLERGDRAAEEFFEMLQAADYPRERLLSLIAYVWSRPVGELHQEVGGVMVTLAAFCQAHGLDMHEAGEAELARVWTKIETIRAKQAAKPTGSALPQAWPVAQGETYVPAGQSDRDIGILLATIDWLAECADMGPEGERSTLIAQIRRDHEARKSGAHAGGEQGTTSPTPPEPAKADSVAWCGPYKSAADALNDLRKSVAEIIGEDPNTWPAHGNAPLAIAATLALSRRATPPTAPVEPQGFQMIAVGQQLRALPGEEA
ncbi:hypothetical protein [Xanthobacter autotrophicus]|uniref:hypothetical protein n=1 Tax=Xanthobacter autotrophicus TaxID=280 RepID=UPI003727D2FA